MVNAKRVEGIMFSFPIHCYFPPPELGDSTVTLLIIFPGIPRNYLPNLCSLTFDLPQKEGAKRNMSPSSPLLGGALPSPLLVVSENFES